LLLVTIFFYLMNKETAKDECVITFLDNFLFFWVPSMKNIILNILTIRPNFCMCLVFFYFQDCWVVGGRLGWLYFINSLQMKQWYNSFIICKILNISFQKRFPAKYKMYVVKIDSSVTHFVWQNFFPFNFKCLSNKKY
jgi:hypothetical protein